MLKVFRRILRVFGILLVLCIAAGIAVPYFYGDKLTRVVIDELNKSIQTPVNVKKVRLTFFKNFPDASVEFQDMTIFSSKQFDKGLFAVNTDTLLNAKRVFLQFNLYHFLRKQYIIKKIEIKSGDLYFFRDIQNRHNAEIIAKGKQNSEGLTWQIRQITCKDIRFYTEWANPLLSAKTYVKNLAISGNFSRESMNVYTSFHSITDTIEINGTPYITDRTIKADFQLNRSGKTLEISKGSITLSVLNFWVQGEYTEDEKDRIKLQIEGDDIDLKTLMAYLPEKYKDHIADYNGKGVINFTSTIEGFIGKGQTPEIESKFSLQDGMIQNRKTNIKLENLQVNGIFTHGKSQNRGTSFLTLDPFNFTLGKGKFSGAMDIINFVSPRIHIQLLSTLDYGELAQFINTPIIEELKGEGEVQLELEGTFKKGEKITTETLLHLKKKGWFRFDGVDARWRGLPYTLKNATGTVAVSDDQISPKLNFNVLSNNITFEGTIDHFFDHVNDSDFPLEVRGRMLSDKFNLLPFFPEKGKGEKDTADYFLGNHSLSLAFAIHNFTFKDFSAEKATGEILYTRGNYKVNSLSLQTLDGNILGSGQFIQTESGAYLQIQSRLKQIDIHQTFRTFKNFGQDFIQYRHIQGKLSGIVDFTAQLDGAYRMIDESVTMESRVTIDNGQLVDFEPMLGLSRFIKVEELEHVQFSRLENEIYISHKKVIIPKMNITSSAFNISGYGEHHFDSPYEYHVNVLLSEILGKKAREAKKENKLFGEVEDDGLGKTRMFLKIVGDKDDYKVSYDKKQVLEKIKTDLKQEKTRLKEILHEEFGLFKKDSTLQSEKTRQGKPFRIIWDENVPEKKDSVSRKPSSGFEISWDEMDTLPAKRKKK